ncbi:hypothetical protein HGP16_22985 [Rhizobium sp. P40RR-XXII]|uniref:hypothetical protein n=1 Tax=unclassified Rhizobium TaxID=2613769 RepID=UPI00145660C2|nr:MULTISPECIES: hypothetical protein [unclassified Rhizobium]NLR85812.1 hypothetical protein [Rhizobium sp. P28RR-XV]NLS19408.1 hypothetical protein [Rhizobium sp. P40RR-XXII]
MDVYKGKISKEILGLFTSGTGSDEFFSYVGNLVSVEQALAVFGILSPDFIEHENHVFWRAKASADATSGLRLVGLMVTETGQLQPSSQRIDVERYQNNFSVSQFFSKWEDTSENSVSRVGLTDKDYQLCHVFAQQLVRYWKIALFECFPHRTFEFEVADDLLDEYGVCLTFWQPENSV